MSKYSFDAKAYLPEFQKLAQAIAEGLGGHVEQAPDLENYWYARIASPELPVALDLRGYDGRLEVRVAWPSYRDEGGRQQTVFGRDVLSNPEYQAARLDISVALSRGADAIVKDIKRRLIPSAKPVYEKAVQTCRDRENYQKVKAGATARLMQALGVSQDPRKHSGQIYLDDGVRLSVSGDDSVRFDYFYVDVDTAIEIVKLIRKSKEGKQS